MARPKDDSKIEAIASAALSLVLKEGFGGFKMSQLAQKAGIATGTLYVYFKNKEELINQLYINIKRQSMMALLEGYEANQPFMIGFETLWRNYLNYCLSKPEEGAFVEQYYRSPYLRPEIVEETDRLLLPIFELLEKGKREKLINPLPTELLVAQLIGSIQEIVRWHLSQRLELTPEIIDQTFRMAWNSIKG